MMMRLSFRAALLFAFLTAAVSGQPKATGIKGRQYMYCSCSPTTGGYRTDAYKELTEGAATVAQKIRELQRKTTETPTRRTAELAKDTQEVWSKCVFEYSMEECVNADVALRANRKCYPNCMSFCEYDSGSWRNIDAGNQYAPSCDTDSSWKADIPQRLVDEGAVEPSVKNPRPAPAAILAGKPVNARSTPPPGRGRPTANVGVSSIPADEVESDLFTDNTDTIRPKPARKNPSLPQQAPTAATTNTNTGAPVAIAQPADGEEAPEQPVPVDGSTVGTTPAPATEEVDTPIEPEIGAPDANFGSDSAAQNNNTNEGCVAVEHLEGYVMQYKRSFLRPVLCAHGFCATPNHAIIVDRAWTSMTHMCSKTWKCVDSVKLVNNLNVFANRRAVVDNNNVHITITPYDHRFPRWCTWVAQFAYEILHLVLGSLVLGAVTAVLVLVACAVKEY